MSASIVPCLWFDHEAEQAAAFYLRTFPRGRIIATSRYPEGSDNPAGKPRGSVLTVDFEVAGQRFTALNGGPSFVINQTISFFVQVDTRAEADRFFAAFAEGGTVMMPLDAYPWSERYGWVADRFGVSWQVMLPPQRQRAMIAPCVMFSGAQHRNAEPAMKTWTGIFPGGRIESVERYAAGEGPEGTVKHGRFVLDGLELVAMDSHVDHRVSFNEAVSFQVMCRDQQEIDRYWRALAEGGQESVCGWLKDRYGLSWQVVPISISEWLASADTAARDRAFAAMMKMKKPDVAGLQRAFRGPEHS